jgi:hypothetical protein
VLASKWCSLHTCTWLLQAHTSGRDAKCFSTCSNESTYICTSQKSSNVGADNTGLRGRRKCCPWPVNDMACCSKIAEAEAAVSVLEKKL